MSRYHSDSALFEKELVARSWWAAAFGSLFFVGAFLLGVALAWSLPGEGEIASRMGITSFCLLAAIWIAWVFFEQSSVALLPSGISYITIHGRQFMHWEHVLSVDRRPEGFLIRGRSGEVIGLSKVSYCSWPAVISILQFHLPEPVLAEAELNQAVSGSLSGPDDPLQKSR